ncbi:MAG: glutamate synthase small subunit [Nitrospinaceae bacterium]|nr:glutamate synthase subunit beta [Nitrospinaceae bacterium]NIR57249.1 glutamate synthase subunit beta [Nitrospinaceae bacterium]NIS87697.1 glutamate synthase subunit beta [Nitrospinaceae bacterium]NIT84563.1 glutamate synthase subunit beta [Nitrospinaceae bacterium]NIU46749.1 glutamate synthase subunit beta [Nitrospinaceae bacterium]
MGSVKGFMDIERETPATRPVADRLKDQKEVYQPFPLEKYREQGARCMDCGVPFCQSATGCPLGNAIPDWNDMVYRDQWEEALSLLLSTNNFPEFTGRICPAPCEGACVLGISEPPVTIRNIEEIIAEKGFENGWMQPNPPQKRTGKTVAIVGSGPAGLAAADQLNQAGHSVTVFEKADRIGGLLMYGIPHFKLEKTIVSRRIELMKAEGVEFKTNSHIGVNIPGNELMENYDAVLLCCGSEKPRDLPVEGRDLDGIHFAMDFLPQQNKRNEGDTIPEDISITARDKNVLIIGGGDTGSDCLGTALRQGAKKVCQFELLDEPPSERKPGNPWPQWPAILRVTSSHEEAQEPVTQYNVSTLKFTGENGRVTKVHAVKIKFGEPDLQTGRRPIEEIPGTRFEMDIDLVLLAMGFVHPVHEGLVKELNLELDGRGNVACDSKKMTNQKGIFVAGDMTRGQSLVVWAIAEGREAARSIDEYLVGHTFLPHSEWL